MAPATPVQQPVSPLAGKGHDIELRPLSKHVWLHKSWLYVPRYGRVGANGLVIVGRRGALVVDTSWTDAQMGWLLDRVKAATGKPAVAVVATHWHNDRAGGFAEANRRGVPTIALKKTDEILVAKKLPRPTQTFARSRKVDLGGVTVELFFPGPGHSLDNVVAYVRGDDVLFGGCLIRSGATHWIGNLSDADLASWPATMRVVAKRYRSPRIVVPGHGRSGGAALIQHTYELARAALHK